MRNLAGTLLAVLIAASSSVLRRRLPWADSRRGSVPPGRPAVWSGKRIRRRYLSCLQDRLTKLSKACTVDVVQRTHLAMVRDVHLPSASLGVSALGG